MPKYRKKPVVIEAFKVDEGNYKTTDNWPDWMREAFLKNREEPGAIWLEDTSRSGLKLCIQTLEGTHTASVNDFIIQGVNGELYPCKPDIFEKTYEEVE